MKTQKRKQAPPVAALATYPGKSAIAVIRCSGMNIISIADRLFRTDRKLSVTPSRKTVLGWITDPETKEKIDRVLVTCYRAPASYTGEDMVEISMHGSTYIASAVLKLLIQNGCGTAEPGDFTRRAYLNGKMALSQAESVRELIEAQTARQRNLAVRQMENKTPPVFGDIIRGYENCLMIVEGSIEFPEDEHMEKGGRRVILRSLSDILRKIDKTLSRAPVAEKIRTGLLVPVAGAPNAGKSSLFNWFMESERVIVDPHPGTTRDAVEEELEIAGLKVRLVDTAGIRRAKCGTEKKGIKKTREYLELADIILWIHDSSKTDTLEEKKWKRDFSHKNIMFIDNKCDLKSSAKRKSFKISLKNGYGIKKFLGTFKSAIKKETGDFRKSSDILSVSQIQSIRKARDNTLILLEKLKSNVPCGEEMVAEDIKEIFEFLNPITDKITSDELLNRIFSRFCIGK